MAATSGSALKALIEGLGLQLAAYYRRAPSGETMPYVSIRGPVTAIPDAMEDHQLSTGTESMQVELWEAAGQQSEPRHEGLLAGLHGAQLPNVGTNKRVYTTLVRHFQSVDDPEAGRVRFIIDVDLLRQL
jgi:hypothetical protein